MGMRRLAYGGTIPWIAVMVGVSLPVQAAPNKDYGKIEVIRDQWGIAHVYSDTDEGAMYGLGYSQAEDRCFQMYYFLRTMQGRLAEVIGDLESTDGKNTSVNSDKLIRTMGFYRAAKTVAAGLDAESQTFLRAFSEGVNDYIADRRDNLHPLFEKYKLVPEPWTPANTIVLWWHAAKWFARNGLRDRIVDFAVPPTTARGGAVIRDDTAVVRREDVSDEWIAKVNAFMDEKGLRREDLNPVEPPKFSHAWVIGGKLTTTGAATLVSDPQTPVWNPSFMYEFHFSGKTFNVRGIGVAGSPIILIGFNEKVAWGMSALGADQADLFVLETDQSNPNQYLYDGQWRICGGTDHSRNASWAGSLRFHAF